MGIGSRIKEKLDEQNIAVKELSRRINVPPSTIYSLIRRDSEKVSVDVLLAIANELGTTTDVLLDETRELKPDYIVTTPDNYEFVVEMERMSRGVDPNRLKAYAEAFSKIMEAKEAPDE